MNNSDNLKNISSKKIVLTGGGTAGHVMPHMALLPFFRQNNWDVLYIGSDGIEKTLAKNAGLSFGQIAAGKLRRYFSWENFTDVFKIGIGIVQAFFLLLRFRPDVVFSKGGFVSVPVAVSAKLLRIPVITHESDLTPGLANRIIAPLAAKIFYSFPESLRFLPQSKAVFSGLPIRQDLFSGNREAGRKFCGFSSDDQGVLTILVMGGSLGALTLNEAIFQNLDKICTNYQVVHLCGKGKTSNVSHPRYRAFEFVGPEMPDILALADLVVSRAGANSIFELLALAKPMLLIPFIHGSRGDQVDNAKSFVKNGWAMLLEEKDLTSENLLASIENLKAEKDAMAARQKSAKQEKSSEFVFQTLTAEVAKARGGIQ